MPSSTIRNSGTLCNLRRTSLSRLRHSSLVFGTSSTLTIALISDWPCSILNFPWIAPWSISQKRYDLADSTSLLISHINTIVEKWETIIQKIEALFIKIARQIQRVRIIFDPFGSLLRSYEGGERYGTIFHVDTVSYRGPKIPDRPGEDRRW